MNIVRIRQNKIYVLPSGVFIKIISANQDKNKVIFYSFNNYQNDYMDFDFAEKVLQPAWRIGEVARMFGKKPDTLRRYERDGMLPVPSKIFLDPQKKTYMRVYTVGDIIQIVKFFETRKPPGRPAKTNSKSFVNKKDLMRFINARFKNSDIKL